ncbi:metal-dependent hydrolase [Mangrovimonas xylaniphaga]|uniref:metal-dependent hydrolase n=1 Tax=Mangrovimonas xylaniphaga TaxID=1645915 RepID=UPI0006B45300|nr:metal-dependent hydrolase [Mangrovimonas xylaniphaga]
MDSVTQIVLGAACGELALGKKIGNKALLFGAIGGTIPDLDVYVGRLFYSNEIDIMMFHRGFMHSFLFCLIGTFAFGWLVYKLYDNGKRKDTTSLKDWFWLFGLSLFTHPMLDCFTPYGTQLFTPFSNYRVAFNNISVVDLGYTLPFLICMIVVMFYKRSNVKRLFWTKLGLGLSSFYMVLTLMNKVYMNSVFEKSFKEGNITFSRFRTQPTFFNNILWYGIAEGENNYYVGYYSLLDSEAKVDNIMELPKHHDLIDMQHPDIKQLSLFSDGYFNLKKMDNNEIRYNDLRYPFFNPNDRNSSIFKFMLMKEGERWNIKSVDHESPKREDFEAFLKRLKGV